ncbi:MAG TPA: invasion associated locus B family protein [Rhodopila sp.]|nr:invasion associated locus B family protein [Rhodopila sp.]
MSKSPAFLAFAVAVMSSSALLACAPLAQALAAPAHKPAPARKPAPAAPAGPKEIGKFQDWTAATHEESGQTVCYAFVRAQSSVPTLPKRGPVILTVTERPSLRDTIAIDAGFNYAPNASVTVQVDQTGLEFYTSGRDAFARDGKAAVTAFQKGSRAIARSPGAKEVTDTFSLQGFSAAYAAIVKACPAK